MVDVAALIALIALPVPMARLALDKAEKQFIESKIQVWVERAFLANDERIAWVSIQGDGATKTLRWEINEIRECDGCNGDGRISSNRGTKTYCPDCDGSGELDDGEIRQIITDYDGDILIVGNNRSERK